MRGPVIVSAADAAYFRCLTELLASIVRHHEPPALRCIAYDLGLQSRQRMYLTGRFPFVEIREFDFAGYPDAVRLRDRPVNTNAWKPQLIKAVLDEARTVVLWLDSATVVLAALDPVFSWTERTGFYTPFGGRSTVAELTHPDTLRALGATETIGTLRQRASGVVGFDGRQPRVRALVSAWADACANDRIVIPPGATLATHRFDQSVLNVLLGLQPGLELTDDELDISSDRPTRLFRTRNKVPSWMPAWLSPVARAWFSAYRAIDVRLWRLKARSRGFDRPIAGDAHAAETAIGRTR